MQRYNLDEVFTYNINNKKSRFSILTMKVPTQLNNEIMVSRLILLYESMKYTSHPEIQKRILERKNDFNDILVNIDTKLVRKDWEDIKEDVMYYCLRLGLLFFPMSIGEILRETENMDIVELNKDDDFWGVKRLKGDRSKLVGENVRGKLWMKLRKFYWDNDYEQILKLEGLDIPNFNILGKKIETIYNPHFKIVCDEKLHNEEVTINTKKWEKIVIFVLVQTNLSMLKGYFT